MEGNSGSRYEGAHVLSYDGAEPQIANNVFLAPTATLIGDVMIGAGSSIWFGAVLRGDEVPIVIGENSNIQDGVIIHGDSGGKVHLGCDVTVGHGAILHGCTIEHSALIGMGAIVLDGAVVETGALVAAGAVVSPGKRVEANTLWAGCPAKPIRNLDPKTSMADMQKSSLHYQTQSQIYRSGRVAPITDNT